MLEQIIFLQLLLNSPYWPKIGDPVKHLWCSFFVKIINCFQHTTTFAQTLPHRCLIGSLIALSIALFYPSLVILILPDWMILKILTISGQFCFSILPENIWSFQELLNGNMT